MFTIDNTIQTLPDDPRVLQRLVHIYAANRSDLYPVEITFSVRNTSCIAFRDEEVVARVKHYVLGKERTIY